MNKLQMVDVGKLNEVLNYLKKDNDSKKVLTGITNPSQLNLEEKLAGLDNTSQSQELAGEKIAQFIKTKNTYKRKNPETTPARRRNEEAEGEKEGEEGKEREEKEEKKTPQLRSEQNITSFLKRKKVKSHKDTLVINGVKINENDLIYDLSHNAARPNSYNLSATKHDAALRELKRKNMPANYIRNNALRAKYGLLDKAGISSDSSSSEDPLERFRQLRRTPESWNDWKKRWRKM